MLKGIKYSIKKNEMKICIIRTFNFIENMKENNIISSLMYGFLPKLINKI